MATYLEQYKQLEFGFTDPRIRAVAWDLGDTLIRIKHTAIQKVINIINSEARQNLDVETLEEAIRQEWLKRNSPSENRKIKRVKTRQDEREYWFGFYQNVLESLLITARLDVILPLLANLHSDPDSFELMPGVRETLSRLKTARKIQILISNGFSSAWKVLEWHELAQYFDHVVISYEISSLKPEPQIYRYALRLAKVPARSTLFVDDRIRFVEGARKVGMSAVWLNPKGDQENETTIKKIGDVLPLAGLSFNSLPRHVQ